MINLRYHIISIVAVFLALGIGVLMGSTIVDRALVDNLNGQLDGLQESLERASADNAQLQGELNRSAQLQVGLNDEGTPQLLRGRLAGRTVLVVAVEGVDESAVDDLQRLLQGADAASSNPLWLTDKLRLTSADDAQALAALLGESDVEPTRLRPALAARLALLMEEAGVGDSVATLSPEIGTTLSPTTTADTPPDDPASGATTTTTTAPGAGPVAREAAMVRLSQFLAELTRAGFARSDSAGLSDLDGAAVVVVGGAGASLPDEQLARPLANALAATPQPAVVAAETVGPAVDPGGPGTRGAFVGPLRADDWWRAHGSSVDDLENFAGRAAVVLALDDLWRGVVGQYGLGEDAQRLLPAPPP